MEGAHLKCMHVLLGEKGITPHVYMRSYTIPFHVFVSWCLVLFVEI